MKSKRSVILVLLISLVVSLTLSVPMLAQTKIIFMHWGWPEIENLIGTFNKLHDDISVVYEQVGWGQYFDEVIVRIAAGVGPDVFTLQSNRMPVQAAAHKGILADLTPLWERDLNEINEADWFPLILESYKYQGRLYALGSGPGVIGYIFYNADLFQEFGISTPDETWTWDTMAEVGRKFNVDKTGDGLLDQFGISNSYWWWNRIEGPIVSAGGDIYDQTQKRLALRSDPACRALQFIVGLYANYIIPPEVPSTSIASGNIAMEVEAPSAAFGHLSHWEFTAGLALYPRDPATGGRKFFIEDAPLGIMATTKHIEEAWKFVKWYTSEEGHGRVSYETSGFLPYLPARRSIATSHYFLNPDPSVVPESVDMNIALQAANYVYYPEIRNPNIALERARISSILTEEWRKVITLKRPLSYFIEQAETRVHPLLSK